MTIKERLTKLETLLSDALENHLPHLDTKMDNLDAKFDRFQYLVLTTLVATLLDLASRLWK